MTERLLGPLGPVRTQTDRRSDAPILMSTSPTVPLSLQGFFGPRSVLTSSVSNTVHYVYDASYGWIHEAARQPARRSRESTESTANRLRALLNDAPIESGIPHAAEEILARLLRNGPTDATTAAICLAGESTDSRIDVLRLVGRAPAHLLPAGLLEFVRDALRASQVSVRDAAVRALELIGTPEAMGALRAHAQIETQQWLAEYCRAVVNHGMA